MRRIVFALIATFSAFLLAATTAPVATAQQDTTVTHRPDRRRHHDGAGSSAAARRAVAAGGRDGARRRLLLPRQGRDLQGSCGQAAAGGDSRRPLPHDQEGPDHASEGVWSFKFRGRIGTHWRVLIPETNWARTTRVYIGRIVRD